MKRLLRLNKFFGSIIKNFNISVNSEVLKDISVIQDPVIAAIEKYKQCSSIQKIKKLIRTENYLNSKDSDN